MFRRKLLPFAVVCVLVSLVRWCSSLQTCQWKSYEEPGDINFGMIISVRARNVNDTCGDISYRSLQHVLAVKYALGKINSPGLASNQSLVPGIKLGFTVFDDCGNDKYAASSAMSAVKRTFPDSIVDCGSLDTPIFAGFIGPSRSPSATAVSGLLNSTSIPLIGMATTLSELSDKKKYPNVLRTAVSDAEQSKAIISLVKRLGWSVIAVLHTEDNYGTDLAKSVQRLAKENKICVLHVSRVADLRSVNTATKTLLQKQKGTAENSLGVVYLGHSELITNLMNSLRTEYNDNRNVKHLHWILPDSVGTDADIVKGLVAPSQQDHLGSVWSISPMSLALTEFGLYGQSVLSSPDGTSNSTVPWIQDFVRNCHSLFPVSGCKEFKQGPYIPATIHAVYSMSLAVRAFHRRVCGGASGLCDALNQRRTLGLLNDVRNVELRYADLDVHHTVPELAKANISISFDGNGDVKQKPGEDIYFINHYNQGNFVQVGAYSENGTLQMNTTNKVSSSCGASCEVCVEETNFVYLPGDILLAGFYSLHWAPSAGNPFGCGNFRTEVHTVISVEAFFYTVKKMREKLGNRPNIGAIIFDDCYSFLKADSIIAKYFSGDTPLVDPNTGENIDFSKVVGVIGSESSAVSLPLAESFTRLRIPVISPASTSPDYDDKTIFPYSLRTVVSDRISVEVMVAVIKQFGWTYVNIIYSNNNYGYKAMLLMRKVAQEANICVAEPISINVTPQETDLIAIVKTLNENGARVVVYIGLEEDTKAFQNVIKYHKIELVFLALEDFAVSLKPYDGSEEVTAGSLVVLPMSPRLPWDDFPQYLLNRKPEWTKTSLWFDRFWQSHFHCSLPGRFEKLPSRECNSSYTININDARDWANQFRIGNTINAVASMIKGVVDAQKSLCQTQTEFACPTFKENPSNVTAYIKSVSLGPDDNPYQPYRKDGNGNLDFCIHNLQQVAAGKYEYVKVGTYNSVTRKLTMLPNKPVVFYDNGVVVNNVNGACRVDKVCKACKIISQSVGSPPVPTTSGHNSIQVAILVILCIVCIIVVVILVYLIRQKSQKDKTKQPLHGIWSNPEGSQPSTQTTGHSAIRESPRFQNTASNSISTYISPNSSLPSSSPNGTSEFQRTHPANQQTNLSQVSDENQYLHASSLDSNSLMQRNTRPNTDQTRNTQPNPATDNDMTGRPALDLTDRDTGPVYLQLADKDRTTPKVVASHPSDLYRPLQPVADAHPLRLQRQAEQNANRNNMDDQYPPRADIDETGAKYVAGNTEVADSNSLESQYVNFTRDQQTHPKQIADTEPPHVERVVDPTPSPTSASPQRTRSRDSAQTPSNDTAAAALPHTPADGRSSNPPIARVLSNVPSSAELSGTPEDSSGHVFVGDLIGDETCL